MGENEPEYVMVCIYVLPEQRDQLEAYAQAHFRSSSRKTKGNRSAAARQILREFFDRQQQQSGVDDHANER